jgi:hypothetical protein
MWILRLQPLEFHTIYHSQYNEIAAEQHRSIDNLSGIILSVKTQREGQNRPHSARKHGY